MKKYSLPLALIALLFTTGCKKEETPERLTDVRCKDFEDQLCFEENWIYGTDKSRASITSGSYNGTNCLLITTDSTAIRQNVYTFAPALDSNVVYRLSLYAKFKKTSAHVHSQGHSLSAFTGQFSYLYVFNQNHNSEEPIYSDWQKYQTLFMAQNSKPLQFTISVTDLDSAWIDDIVISRF